MPNRILSDQIKKPENSMMLIKDNIHSLGKQEKIRIRYEFCQNDVYGQPKANIKLH